VVIVISTGCICHSCSLL